MGETFDGAGRGTVDWLLEPDEPGVRARTLTALLGAAADDPEVAAARRDAMKKGPVPRILEFARDGAWGEPAAFYTDKYGGTAWQLLMLAELGADGADPRVGAACEFILAASQERESGGFSIEASKRGLGGLRGKVIPCLGGNMVFALRRLGRAGDGRVAKALEWIAATQRFDDGDGNPPGEWPWAGFEVCYGRHTCHMGAAKALKAFAEVPEDERSPAVRAAVAAGVEYFLAHRVFRRSHDLSAVARPGWLKFGFPLMYGTDALELAWVLARLGCRDGRLGEAIDLVRSKRGSDGRWRLENTFNGKYPVPVGEKGKPSKWVTLRALETLAAFGS